MKTLIILALALMLSIGGLAQEVATSAETTDKATAVPATIDFQGRLHDHGGSPVNATLSIKFSLYDVGSGGTALWTETKSVQVTDGLFQVKLGDVTPFNASHFSGSDRWLGIQVGAEAEMSPRMKISSVGYAIQAAEGGLTLPYAGEGSAANAIFKIVNNDTSGSGIYGISRSTSPTLSLYGVRGDVYSNLGSGLVGAAFSNEGTASGVTGQSQAINGSGVYGRNITNSLTGTSFGVYGVAEGPTGTGVSGIAGYASGNTRGIRGLVASPDGYSGYFEGGRFYVSGNTGIGTLNPAYKLDVIGSFRATGLTLQDGSQGAGKVLTSDASGLASWQTPQGFTLPFEGSCSNSDYALSINYSGGADGSGTGIYLYSPGYTGNVTGINSSVMSNAGVSISGYSFSSTGQTTGIFGGSNSDEGIGIHGKASSGTGASIGILGEAQSSGGIAILGRTLSTSGNPIAIKGHAQNGVGYSGYFLGGRFYVSGNTGIGTENPSAKLEVNGQVKITGGSPAEGKVLTSDANGLASWQPLGNLLPIIDTLAIYKGALIEATNSSDGGIHSDVVGLKGVSSSELQAGGRGVWGVVYGTSGAGVQGNAAASTGEASGVKGFSASTSGIGVLGHAYATLGSNIGVKGQSSSTSGFGVWGEATALSGFTCGIYGTVNSPDGFSGYFSSGKFFVRDNAGFGTSVPSQRVHIKGSAPGNAVLFIEPNQWAATGDYGEIRFGDSNHYIRGEHTRGMTFFDANRFTFSGGNVGIGTDNARAKLEVAANAGPNLIIHDSNGSNDRPGIQFTNNNIHFIGGDDLSEEIFGIYSQYGNTRTYAARLNIHGPATENWGKLLSLTHDGSHGRISTDAGYLVLEPAGMRVGIGTDAPTQSLDVNGTLRVRGMTTGTSAGTVYRTADGTLITGASDIRLKENIETLSDGLAKILQLRGVSFSWKNDPAQARSIGFIAQEFEQVIPELVFTNPVDGYKGIYYAELSAVLVEAMQTQQDKIDLLEQQNLELNARLERLERAMESLSER
ncbi:MAG: tail fiber domain-containing protein [Bacteroides sp.]|jgi:hypothetical protein|nr:tail fiber domain-containing protein [Bacteroides sp.]